MKPELVARLEAEGLMADPLLLSIPLRAGEDGTTQALPPGPVPVTDGTRLAAIELPPLSELLTGRGVPPDFSRAPTEEYLPVFLAVERTAALYCSRSPRPVPDQDFERIYSLLRRRLDGTDPHPLFGYVQAALRLTASIREFSPAEIEAILRRLSKSVRTFHSHVGSTNYFDRALRDLL